MAGSWGTFWQEDEAPRGNVAALGVTHSTATCELHAGALSTLIATRVLVTPARQNGLKLHQVRFRLDITEKFFMGSVVQLWHKLLRTAIESPALDGFKRDMDIAPGDMVQWWPQHC